MPSDGAWRRALSRMSVNSAILLAFEVVVLCLWLPGVGPKGTTERIATDYPGADIGEMVNAAIESCPVAGCTVRMPEGHYEFGTTIRVDRPLVLVGAGPSATTLEYTGGGDALLVEAGSAAPFLTGEIRGFTLEAGGDASENIGVHQVDTIGYKYDEVAIEHFGVGLELDNEPSSFCDNCAAEFNERTTIGKISLFLNRVGILLKVGGSAVNSFGYTRISDVHLQVPAGGVGLEAATGAVLYNSYLGLRANAAVPSTLVWVTGGAVVVNVFCDIAGEADGSGGAVLLRVDPGSAFYGEGRSNENLGSLDIRTGARFGMGVEVAGDAAVGTGAVVKEAGASLSRVVLKGATIVSASVPGGGVLTSNGVIDASVGRLIVPSEVETDSGATLAWPINSDVLVGRSSRDILANKTLLAPALVCPIIDGEAQGSPLHPTLSFFLPGMLDAPWVAARWEPDEPVVVTRVEGTAKRGPQRCAVPAIVALRQAGSTEVDLPITSWRNDTGPIAVALSSSSPVEVAVIRAAFCPRGAQPFDVNVIVQLRSGLGGAIAQVSDRIAGASRPKPTSAGGTASVGRRGAGGQRAGGAVARRQRR